MGMVARGAPKARGQREGWWQGCRVRSNGAAACDWRAEGVVRLTTHRDGQIQSQRTANDNAAYATMAYAVAVAGCATATGGDATATGVPRFAPHLTQKAPPSLFSPHCGQKGIVSSCRLPGCTDGENWIADFSGAAANADASQTRM